ncbi:ABC transporter permease [Floricoccus penangensis]|uniref:ABC transporter permease n=1 Tax=Floricoccus penangensis TaxID=1859475 RepID=UPI001570874E|nr:iron chelate uptake ABC transporter family permease subunit [Floricoccus penangensis]
MEDKSTILKGVEVRKYLPLMTLLLVSLLSLFIGVHNITIDGILHGDSQQLMMLNKVRLPRTISLILAGGMVSISGKVMQHMMQNKFVSAGTIGMMDSARLGILVAMLFFPASTILLKSTFAFIFAFISSLTFLALSRLLPKGDEMILPLAGIMYGNIIGSVAIFFAYQFQIIQNLSSWLQGNFSTIMKGQYELIYLTVPVFIALYLMAYKITVLGLGDEVAASLGMNYKLIQLIVLVLVSLGSSSVLIMVGSIPFLGIIIPNLVSILYGDHLKNTLNLIWIFGSIFLVVCDILSRTLIAPYEIPVSVIVGSLGGAMFIFFLLRRMRK